MEIDMKKLLVLCKDYNGYKNIIFMMNANDDRLNTPNREIISEGKYSRGVLTTLDGRKFKVHCDWSVTQI